MGDVKVVFKCWFELDGRYLFGEGLYELLGNIMVYGSLSEAAKVLDMSYRHAWGMIKGVESILGKPLLHTHKGGRNGGGAELTEVGMRLYSKYKQVKELIVQLSLDDMFNDFTL